MNHQLSLNRRPRGILLLLGALIILVSRKHADARDSRRRRTNFVHADAHGITVKLGEKDHRGRVLSVASRSAPINGGNLLAQLQDQTIPMMAADRRSAVIGDTAVNAPPAPPVQIELQLMPDEDPMVFDLREDTKGPGRFSGHRNPLSHPVNQETFGEINLITNSNGDISG